MKKITMLIAAGATLLAITGCMSASQHAAEVKKETADDRITVGTVQREIRQGMSGAEVAQVLGSPNIVSTDEKRREVWVYDKVATDTVYSTSQGGVAALILAGSGGVGGLAGGTSGYGAGAKSTSQRTLTIVIKYDEAGKVRDFSYHSTRF
ncbi:hypothetical protein D3OALGA1CA_2872 [Olavius algarvensis associated proteobacterium Delta 3]|nr:hypothetical protein D3OALGA1CA_2872 [Olavius algarvensis associated proteobacterium Delta 3]CAB5163011.1 hypothetical protein D3OALGB2SA_5552 [Olavius algarvensis associated proteobacterium Delta 3]